VDSNASGNNKYFIDGDESPRLELIPGLPYFFHLDGNTTLGHPFYFGISGTGGDNYNSEYSEGVTRSREVNGTISLSLESSLPERLFYLCGNHSGMGNEIIIPKDPRSSYILKYGAFDKFGNQADEGNWTVTTDGGQNVTAGQDVFNDSSVLLTYTPPLGFKLVGWDGTPPTGKEIIGESLKLPMTSDLNVTAIVSSIAPRPEELSSIFDILLSYQDQESNTTEDDFSFIIESDGESESTEGKITLGDSLRGNFTYSQSSPAAASIIVSSFEMNLDNNGTWEQKKGGGFALELSVGDFTDNLGNGTFVRYYNDGTVDMGTWESSNIRSAPITFEGN